MVGPSMAAIRNACREVSEEGTETGGQQQPTGRRNLTPAGRKKIADAARARHARKKAGQATTSTEQPQATAKKANHQKAMPAAG